MAAADDIYDVHNKFTKMQNILTEVTKPTKAVVFNVNDTNRVSTISFYKAYLFTSNAVKLTLMQGRTPYIDPNAPKKNFLRAKMVTISVN